MHARNSASNKPNCESYADKLDTENDSENLRFPTATDMLSLLSHICRYVEANSEGECLTTLTN